MTGRLFRTLHGLRDDGQAWGSILAWVGLVAFCAASPISIAATNIAWGIALAGAIAAFLPFSLLGIAAIVLLALSKEEFE